jgi:hypothetical protein
MIRPRSACITIGAGLAATALAIAAVLPAQAATGTGWRIVSNRHFGAAGDYNYLSAVVAPSASDAWAFGSTQPDGATPAGGPLAENWNGTKWQAATLPSGLTDTLTAASAPSATDIWAVTDLSGTVLYYNGTTWSVAKQFPETGTLPQELTGVTAFSPTNVWVWGSPGEDPGLGTWHLQGTTWTQVTGTGGEVAAASALSPSNIWAVGGDSNAPQDIIVHYNGTAWQQVTSTALDNVQFSPTVLALSATNVWTAGEVFSGSTGVAYLLHMSGTTWTRVKIPWKVNLSRVASDGSGGLWVTASTIGTTGNQWYVLHRTKAGVWSRSKIGASDQLIGITSIPGTTSMWGAGSKPPASGTGANAAIWADGTLP